MRVPLDRLGVFPRPQQPRVLWVGPAEGWERSEEAARVADLHRTVESGCRSLGMAPDEKPLAPHLTLARIKAGEREMGRVLAGSGVMEGPTGLGTLALDSIVLMKSELRPTGSLYTKVWSVPLGK
jgi:2'-5' RNA ligase